MFEAYNRVAMVFPTHPQQDAGLIEVNVALSN